MAAKDRLGREGEELAAAYLRDAGFAVIDRNWRTDAGEIDIVALDRGEIVVVEVKTRSSLAFGHPLEAVDARKRARLWRVGLAWCAAHPERTYGRRLRVDVIGILTGELSRVTLEHLRDVR